MLLPPQGHGVEAGCGAIQKATVLGCRLGVEPRLDDTDVSLQHAVLHRSHHLPAIGPGL